MTPPAKVRREVLLHFVRGLGFDEKEVREVRMDGWQVTVTLLTFDDNGNMRLLSGEPEPMTRDVVIEVY